MDETGLDDTGDDLGTDENMDETGLDDTGDTDTEGEENTDDNGDGLGADENMEGEENSDENYDDETGNEELDEEQKNEEKIKNKKLINNYFDLLTNMNSMLDNLSNVEGNDKFESSTLVNINKNLQNLKYAVNDYINIRFAKRSYEENLSMFYKMENTLKITCKLISNICEKRDNE